MKGAEIMHNIEYYSYAENVKRSAVEAELDEYVSAETYAEGGGGLTHPIRWLDGEFVCKDELAARELIEKRDKGWYDQLAARYYEAKPKQTKALEELRQKIKDTCDEYRRRDGEIWAEGVKAEFVGCKACGSKLSRVHIRTNRCPVCRADLRTQSMLKSVEAARAKWIKAQDAEKQYAMAHSDKKVMWLVKIEYHT